MGMSEPALYNRLRTDTLKAKLTEAKQRLLENAATDAQRRLTDAVTTMYEIMSNESNAPSIRLTAADAILRNGLRLTQAVDVARRLDEVEKMIHEIRED